MRIKNVVLRRPMYVPGLGTTKDIPDATILMNGHFVEVSPGFIIPSSDIESALYIPTLSKNDDRHTKG